MYSYLYSENSLNLLHISMYSYLYSENFAEMFSLYLQTLELDSAE